METDRTRLPPAPTGNAVAWSSSGGNHLDVHPAEVPTLHLEVHPAQVPTLDPEDIDWDGADDLTVPSAGRPDAAALHRRTRRRLAVTYAVGGVMLVAAVVAAFAVHAQLGRTDGSLASTSAGLHRTIAQVATARKDLAAVSNQSTVAASVLSAESAQLAADQQQLAAAEATIHAKGVSISDLDTCLSGVEKALNQISLGDRGGAAATLGGVSASCQRAQPSG
jgi:hypothetical protein